jgi:hypothetical protein
MRFRVLLGVLALSWPAYAASGSGTQGAAFLDIPIGGAPAAMGSAYTALATDAYAPVLNPAGLGFLDSPQFAGHHISYLETSYYDFFSYVHPINSRSALGISAQYLGSGNITQRDDTGAENGSYSAHYGAYSFAFGQAVTDRLSLGLTSRWINSKIADVSANAYAADVGALYKVSNELQTGLSVTNAGSRLKFINDSDALPLTVHAGGAYFFPYHITGSAEAAYENTGIFSGRFGSQWQVIPAIALRAGYRTDVARQLSTISGFSTGIGLSLWGSEFSYTWIPYDDLGQTHSFSLLMKFGQPRKNRNILKDPASQSSMTPDQLDLAQMLTEWDGGKR